MFILLLINSAIPIYKIPRLCYSFLSKTPKIDVEIDNGYIIANGK